MDCLFCNLANNNGNYIYEDDTVVAFLDINPVCNGHTLIMPKNHILNTLDTDLSNHIKEVIKKLYPMYKEKLGCTGLTIVTNCDSAQAIKHYHVHMIPRYDNDGVDFTKQDNLLEVNEVFNKLK